jgi:hypothetical protein
MDAVTLISFLAVESEGEAAVFCEAFFDHATQLRNVVFSIDLRKLSSKFQSCIV